MFQLSGLTEARVLLVLPTFDLCRETFYLVISVYTGFRCLLGEWEMEHSDMLLKDNTSFELFLALRADCSVGRVTLEL